MTFGPDIDPGSSPEDLTMLCTRAMRRGARLRLRRRLLRGAGAAALLAAVVVPAGVALAGPSGPSGGDHPDVASAGLRSAPAGPFEDVAWRQVDYPGLNFADVAYPHLGCGAASPPTATGVVFPVDVQQVAYVQPAGRPATIALVLVRCTANGGPPSWLYAFQPATDGQPPRLVQVLLAEPRGSVFWQAQTFTVSGDRVAVAAEGSTAAASACCPNVSVTFRWAWRDGTFQPDGGPTSTAGQ